MEESEIESRRGRKTQSTLKAGRVLKSSSKHQWTKQEDAILVQCLHELANDPRWKGDNGTFQAGYLTQFEKMMETKLPQSDLKSHPSAKGLRNKTFPHFDDFIIIFGKDRATGECAKTTADAMEASDRNEQDEFEDDNHDLEGEKESNFVTAEGSNCHTSTTPISARAELRRKRSRSSDGFSELVDQIKMFEAAYKKTAEEINGIATFFKQETDASEKRVKIFSEIMHLEGFTKDELLTVEEYISKEKHKVDFFIALPAEFRRDFIVKQLNECCPYRPSFDFNLQHDRCLCSGIGFWVFGIQKLT
ncbi:hypothetical protein PTKIN_Ptkin13bG0150700 [Pterospermum kingtungense]